MRDVMDVNKTTFQNKSLFWISALLGGCLLYTSRCSTGLYIVGDLAFQADATHIVQVSP